jgi:hypothetical protein
MSNLQSLGYFKELVVQYILKTFSLPEFFEKGGGSVGKGAYFSPY